jgi:ATP-dependent Lhr-like helicase
MPDSVFSLFKKPIRIKLEKEQVTAPSEIQKLAIPAILSGKNTLVIAPTGTGKTYAAMLPVLDLFLSARSEKRNHGISILYVTPLRALNRDLLRRLSEMGQDLDIDIQVRHGDTPARTRTLQAKLPPDMLITTPETLQAILPGKKMRMHLKSVRWVIVDEIHELVTDKRGVQLSVALERLQEQVGKPFQRIGLSATIGDVKSVANFLGGTERDVQVLKAADLKKLRVDIEFLTTSKKDVEKAAELGIPPATVARVKRICEMIDEHKSSLVFTNTREHAEALGVQIQAVCGDIPVKVHHGSLSREIREEVERSFQNGSTKSVVCTSSLELGIDVGSVDFIIQYMSPRQATRLIQRVGRSGHKVEAESRGCIVSAWADDILESSVIVDHATKDILEPAKIHMNALDVLAHQIVGITLDMRPATLEDTYRIVRQAYPYKDLQPEEFTATVQQLVNERLVRTRDGRLQPVFPKAFAYYYENLSVIPDVKRYTVIDFIRKRKIGTLDQEFVARRCRSGSEFVMHGHTWKIIAVNEQDLTVEVEPTNPSLNAIPSWEGEIIPVDFLVATEVGQVRETLAEKVETGGQAELQKDLHINEFAIAKVLDTIRAQKSKYPIPTAKRIVVENFENCVLIHSCFGNLVNETLAIVLATLLSAKLGANIATQTDAYRIALISPYRVEPSVVANELGKLSPEDLKFILDQAIERTDLFAWRNWHVARRFGAVQKSAEYKSSRGRLLADVYKSSPIGNEARHEIYLEKLDLENAMAVLSEIRNRAIVVEVAEQRGEVCSPLALPMIDKIVPHGMLRPAVPTSSLVEIIRERLTSQMVRLVCIFNADWDALRVVKTLPEKIKCPHCRSTLVAATYRTDDELIVISRRKKNGRTLSHEEKEHWDRAWRSASLVQVAGKKAVLAMSGRGVGPVTAARILRKSFRNDNELYVEILKAEREYARTRLFWD